jgi:hypothetical protein
MDIKLNVCKTTDRLELDVKANRWGAEELAQALRDADMKWLQVSERYVALKRLRDASVIAKVPFAAELEEELELLTQQTRKAEYLRSRLRSLNTYLADQPMALKRQMTPKPVVRRTPPSNRASIPYPAGAVFQPYGNVIYEHKPPEVVFSIPENMEAYN